MSQFHALKKSSGMTVTALAVATLIVALALAGGTAKSDAAAGDTVHIRGVAYAFFGIDEHLPGAVVRIDEYPALSTPVELDGSYDIEVPDDANVTPYIDTPAGYSKTYLQTFHTSGEDLEHVHFQVPKDSHYTAFSNLLEIPRDKEGVIEDCVIVSTFSIHEARDATEFDPGFKDVYPHGLKDSTAAIDPVAGNTKGPVYFNYKPAILPDPTRVASSEDGGVLWTEVPPGYYWLQPEHPTERLAPFLAHCESGRVVNASPPWGFYELKPGEEPDPAVMAVAPDEVVDAKVARKPVAVRKGSRRIVKLSITAGEPLAARMTVSRGKVKMGSPKTKSLKAGRRKVAFVVRRNAPNGRSKVSLRLSDKAGNRRLYTRVVRVPR